MTTKDYTKIAEIIANRFSKVDKWQYSEAKHATLTEIITITEDLIHVLEEDNPRFDKIKFIGHINSKRTDKGTLLV